MALDFYGTLDRLLNPTHDMGGGPGAAGTEKSIAQLILGGGNASVQNAEGTMVPIMGQGVNPSLKASLPPSLQRVMADAERIAAGARGDLAGGSTDVAQAGQGNSLVANPYGPGSYVATNPAAVAQIQAEGQRMQKVDQGRQLIDQLRGTAPSISPMRMSDPGEMKAYEIASGNYRAQQERNQPLVKQVLDSLGLGEDVYKKAFQAAKGKAEGEKAGGKGTVNASSILAAAGKPEFADLLSKASADGSLTVQQQMGLERANNAALKRMTPEEKSATGYENAQAGVKRMERMSSLYDKAIAGGETISQNLKLALSQGATFSAFLQNKSIPFVEGLTDDEAAFVAEANSMLIGARQMMADDRLSNDDVKRFLVAIGSAATGPKLFKAQMSASTQVMRERGESIIHGLKARGKDVSGLTGQSTSEVQEGTLPSGKRFRIMNGKMQVED